ncbi:SsrA-binding protein SmpB [Candidatus Parcubacteria bacterium]|jgi:SsrA-binding protein|nr:MAG: SsrA-binding protein SmpB [Candidatus Parcubacteria bacterium]
MSMIAENKKARFDYEILETFVGGIVLTGHEAKSAKMGRMDLSGSHAILRGGEIHLLNSSIHSFQKGNAPKDFEELRTRKLLLSKKEIREITGKLQSGFSLVPLKAFISHGFVKIELALARGKKKSDKRETIKKRETEREIQRGVRK